MALDHRRPAHHRGRLALRQSFKFWRLKPLPWLVARSPTRRASPKATLNPLPTSHRLARAPSGRVDASRRAVWYACPPKRCSSFEFLGSRWRVQRGSVSLERLDWPAAFAEVDGLTSLSALPLARIATRGRAAEVLSSVAFQHAHHEASPGVLRGAGLVATARRNPRNEHPRALRRRIGARARAARRGDVSRPRVASRVHRADDVSRAKRLRGPRVAPPSRRCRRPLARRVLGIQPPPSERHLGVRVARRRRVRARRRKPRGRGGRFRRRS